MKNTKTRVEEFSGFYGEEYAEKIADLLTDDDIYEFLEVLYKSELRKPSNL